MPTTASVPVPRSVPSFIANNTTRAAVFFRRDRHSEYNDNRPTNQTARTIEPEQHNEEQTSSLALEKHLEHRHTG